MAENANRKQPPNRHPQANQQDIAAEVARVRSEWQGVRAAIVAASEGNQDAVAQLVEYFDIMEQHTQWEQLIGILRRILAGERDPDELMLGLDPVDSLIVGDTLQALHEAQSPQQVQADELIQGLLGAVHVACSPEAPPGLVEQMHTMTLSLANDGGVPVVLREYGRILNNILSGERHPDLSGLPAELADPLRELLASLRGEPPRR